MVNVVRRPVFARARRYDAPNMTKPAPEPVAPRGFPWGWAAIVGVVVAALAAQPRSTVTRPSDASSDGVVATAPAVTSLATGADVPIADVTLKLAARHAGLALGADGFEGAATYSVNCWAALDRRFELERADRCAAFDAMAAGQGEDAASVPAWFAEANVAARYQAVMTAHPDGAGDASARLERLRVAAAVQTVTLVTPKPAEPLAPSALDEDVETTGDDAGSPATEAGNSSGMTW